LDIRKLQRAIVDGLEDVKAQNIAVFNTEHLSPLFERVIIASGTSNRQTKALAASVRDAVKSSGLPVLRTEGEENGEWIIVDCGAAVAHIMQPAIRQYYHLEEIWGDKPVRLKFGAPQPLIAQAAKTGNGKAGAATSAAGKTTAAKGATGKTAAKKAPATSAARGATRSGATGKTAGKSTGKPPARAGAKSAAKATAKSPARKSPAGKAAAPRKSPAKTPR
jgi:ribosome-associated protein